MPRTAREKSETGIYHIMLRGNERRDIFIDDEDRFKFIDTLGDKIEDGGYRLYAYCLMDNHVHLVVRETRNKIAHLVKRVCVSYAYYFNKKYRRVGHLFQDRFKSEKIESDGYLLSAVRYIHKNPVKAGIAGSEEQYPWSSCRAYSKNANYRKLIDTDFVLGILSSRKEKAAEMFEAYCRRDEEGSFIDMPEESGNINKLSRPEAVHYIAHYLQTKGIGMEDLNLKACSEFRYDLILYLRRNSELSIRGIADLLGLNRGMVARVNP